MGSSGVVHPMSRAQDQWIMNSGILGDGDIAPTSGHARALYELLRGVGHRYI